MNIYPAMDLRAGHCVRLLQGDFSQETQYSAAPTAVLQSFVDQGASWIHIVDLDGARDPLQAQTPLIETLLKNTTLHSQVGGGIRNPLQIETLLAANCSRVMIGSIAVNQPALVREWLQHFGAEKIVLTLDVKYVDHIPYVTTHAWQKTSDQSLISLIEFYQKHGLKHLLCTDISRDGTLQGSHHALYQMLQEHFPQLHIQASGGVNSLADLRALKKLNISGAVVGKSLYENCFTLAEALAC